ncbi:MAG: aminoacyl-tRNA hydrolase [Candidatus Moraniibacteriota bacterium]|jgi:peptidyl-tRNA hydrolase, PTH1 family
MKLIIGLGNPGSEYEKTRHNAGFILVDVLQSNHEFSTFTLDKKFNAQTSEGFIDTEKYILVKPQTFMNRSGESVRAIIDFYKIDPEDITVAADDLDIEIGNYKITRDSRAAGHNGIQNIIDNIGTQDFTRIKLGVEVSGGRKERGEISGHNFVLQNFSSDELTTLDTAIKNALTNLQ